MEPLPAAVALAAALLVVLTVRRSLVVAQPDEWLLCVRNGRLVKAGVGIHLWRIPGDVVVRFTSTVQRVSFAVEALSAERLPVGIEGFIMWSVSPGGDAPFRAFRKLGLVNLDAPPPELTSARHLLSTPQHRAFRQLLGAAVQRLAPARTLEELLLRQDALVRDLRAQLAALEQDMGIHVDEIEIQRVRPADAELLRRLAAEVDERVRERAEAARLETDRQVQEREHGLLRERALAEEARTLEVARAVLDREELQLVARLDRLRREAEAQRDAIAAVASAEEGKSQGVRDHELARLVAEKVGEALRALPLHDARWISIGSDSPASSLAGLITAAKEGIAASASGRAGS